MNLNLKKSAAAALALVAPLASFAQTDPGVPSAADQVAKITAGQGAYSTVMFALALTAVGIMVGVKWIKRGKGAA